jgi:hypothetical protein
LWASIDALEVVYCPNVEVKKRQERELSEFGDLQLSSWISCWTRIHVSTVIRFSYVTPPLSAKVK